MESNEIGLLNLKLDEIIYEMKKKNELSDLSSLEARNFGILIAIIAITISLSFSLNIFDNQFLSWISLAIIYSSLFLIIFQTLTIYRNNMFNRFLFFHHIIYYISFILIIPFITILLFYIWEAFNINTFIFSIIHFGIFILIVILLRLIIIDYLTVNLFFKFCKRFPIIGYDIFNKLSTSKWNKNIL